MIKIKIIMCIIGLMVLLSSLCLAEPVEPYEIKELPQITSSVKLDTEGLTRTYLYCSWHIGKEGEEAIEMTNDLCPATKPVYTFENDETYFARVDYGTIGYSQADNEWQIITTGSGGEIIIYYDMDVPEPPQTLLNMIYNTILATAKNAICTIFPFLGIC